MYSMLRYYFYGVKEPKEYIKNQILKVGLIRKE